MHGDRGCSTCGDFLFGFGKLEEINPQQWLGSVLKRINDHSINNLNELLPANWKNKHNLASN